MSIPPKTGALLGFAKKAGLLESGESAVVSALKKKKAKLLLVAADSPIKRTANWEHWSAVNGIECLILGTKQDWGNLLGVSERSILAVTDQKMADAILKTLRTAAE